MKTLFTRIGLASLFVGALLCTVLFLTREDPPPHLNIQVPRANVVFICIDAVRGDVVRLLEEGRRGQAYPLWAQKAVNFTAALAPAPWTIPSVASLLTGTYPSAHGAGSLEGDVVNLAATIPSSLNPEVPTLAETLSSDGYQTAAFSAHPWFRSDFGLQRGFSTVRLIKERDQIVGSAADWLSSLSEGDSPDPFFLYLHFMDAHEKYRAKGKQFFRYWRAVPDSTRELAAQNAPSGICEDPKSLDCRRFQVYVHSVSELLSTVSGFLRHLERSGLLSQTVVVLYSDHGEEFREHLDVEQERAWDPRAFYGSGHGQSLFQELLHVPLVFWHPEVQPGQVRANTSLTDVVPLILYWTGQDSSMGYRRGHQLALHLSDINAPERPLFASGIAYGVREVAAIQGRWKRVVTFEPETRLLFDLREDPMERNPTENPSIATQLDLLIDDYWATQVSTEQPQLTEEQLRRLQSLGYLGGVEK